MSEEGRSNWKVEMCRLAAMVAAALTALWLLMTYPSLPLLILCVLSLGGVAWYADGVSKPKNAISTRHKAVFITGCDSGLGQALALRLDEIGVQVFAGCLQPRAHGVMDMRNKASDRLSVVQCDVTSDEQVRAALEQVQQNLGNNVLWGVVNSACEAAAGDVELTPMRRFHSVYDVNYLGMVRVTKAFLPLIRKSKGRVVNVTSVAGRMAIPCSAAYASASAAGEAFSNVLRMELSRFGGSVSIIEPCVFSGALTNFETSTLDDEHSEIWAELPEEARHVYGEAYVRGQLKILKEEASSICLDLSLIAGSIEDALFSFTPRSRYTVGGGRGIKMKAMLKPWLPDWLMDRILLRSSRARLHAS